MDNVVLVTLHDERSAQEKEQEMRDRGYVAVESKTTGSKIEMTFRKKLPDADFSLNEGRQYV